MRHARKIVLSKSLTIAEKRMIALENFLSLVKRPEEGIDHPLHKVAHYDTPGQIPDHLLPLIEERPQAFDHNIFQGIQSLILMLGENIISKRHIHHLYHVLSYLYLFQKNISHHLTIKNSEHLISIKILRTTLQSKMPVLAVLICFNFTKEREKIDQKKLIKVIQSHLKYSRLVEDSFIYSQDKDHICTVYLEMIRKDGHAFPQSEVKKLKQQLPKKIHSLYTHRVSKMGNLPMKPSRSLFGVSHHCRKARHK